MSVTFSVLMCHSLRLFTDGCVLRCVHTHTQEEMGVISTIKACSGTTPVSALTHSDASSLWREGAGITVVPRKGGLVFSRLRKVCAGIAGNRRISGHSARALLLLPLPQRLSRLQA